MPETVPYGNPLFRLVTTPPPPVFPGRTSLSKTVSAPPKGYNELLDLYTNTYTKYSDAVDKNRTEPYDYENSLKLSKGKFNMAKVPTKLIDDVIESSKRTGVDVWDMLGLIGQESTFGGGLDKRSQARGKMGARGIVSGWDLSNKYQPTDIFKFFGDKGAEGIKANKTPHGYVYEVVDQKKLENWIAKNPRYARQYEESLAGYTEPGQINWFDEMATAVKQKSLKNYNAGDKQYVSDVTESKSLLMQDPQLVAYVKSKMKG